MTAQKSKFFRPSFLISAAILLLLLVGLPIGSWYYLQSGLEYRQSLLADLKDYGKIPEFTLQTVQGEPFTNQDIAGRMVVASFLDFKDETLLTQFGEVLNKLHDQFDERNDVAFLMHLTDTTATNEAIEDFATTYALTDQWQCYFLRGADATSIAQQIYKTPQDTPFAYFALADTSNTVRRHYDVRQESEVKRLVEHIALILPQNNERRSVSNRDPE